MKMMKRRGVATEGNIIFSLLCQELHIIRYMHYSILDLHIIIFSSSHFRMDCTL
jgi:hypothetical protein